MGLAVNVLLAGLKFAGGLLGGSQAVVADAVHSVSDITTDVAVLVGLRYWSKPADADHPHGHRRIETLVTLSMGLVLALVAAGLLWNALATLSERHNRTPGWVALYAALLSLVCKEALYRWTAAAGRRIKSMPLIANAWHHRSDALSSIPAALAVGGAMVAPSWAYLDHVGAAVVSFFIFQAAFKIVRPAIGKLADAGASDEKVRQILRVAKETEGARDAHGLRTRYAGCMSLAVDLHVLVDAGMTVRDGHMIAEKVKERLLAADPDIVDVVVHLEPDLADGEGG